MITTSYDRPASCTFSVHVVQPRVWPGVRVRDERRAAERDGVAVVQHPVDRVRLSARLHAFERRHVLRHRHHLRAGQLLDERVAFLMIAVRMAAEQNLRVGELEPQLLDRLLDHRHVAFVRAVDEDVALRRHDQKRREAGGSDVIQVADDLVRRKLRRLIVGPADVALKQLLLRPLASVDGHADGRPGRRISAALRRERRFKRDGDNTDAEQQRRQHASSRATSEAEYTIGAS